MWSIGTLCHELCKKTAESKNAELGGSREHVLHGDVDAHRKGHFWGCLAAWKAYSFGGWVKGWVVPKKGGPILTMYTLYDILPKELPFGSRNDCTCIKIFSGATH